MEAIINVKVCVGLSGFLARVVAVSITTPLELVRTLQSGGRTQRFDHIARKIVAQDGITGLYRGWIPTLLRDCPYSAIYWFSFDAVRPLYTALFGDSSPSFATFSSGASAGMIAAFITHPFDVVKTKRQLAVLPSSGSPSSTSQPQISFASILRNEGVKGLYRGLSMRLVTVIPASAIMITVYEAVKNIS